MAWDGFLNDKLKQRQYQYRNEAKRDIVNVLKIYPDLRPEESVYVGEDGKQTTLVCLSGTIPVHYKGTSYNIPIQVWLLHGHPHQAPLVYVKPTSTMVVKPNRNVDLQGRVYLPFLTSWSQNQANKSDLIQLVQELQIIFGQVSPVYAKSAQQPPPRPPYPSPYPNNQPVPHGGMGMPQPGGYASSYPTSHPGYPTSHGTPYPSASTTPYTAHTTSGYSTAYSMPGNPTPYPSATTAYPATTVTPYPVATVQSQVPSRQGSVIDERTVRMSLLTTAEDKLKQRIREVFEMGRIEQDQLQITKTELESGNKALNALIRGMNNEKANLEANISLLDQKNKEINDMVQKLQDDSENMNIDEAVVTTTPLYNQILDLFAEESAIEDALYYLSEGLRREAVELDVFLKSVRKMSRRQFMLRATLLKARETAGLR